MRPDSFEIFPIYKCDKCSEKSTSLDLQYINKVGKWLCSCGHVIVLDEIRKFDVVLNSDNTITPPPITKIKNTPKKKQNKKTVTKEYLCNMIRSIEEELSANPNMSSEDEGKLQGKKKKLEKILNKNITKISVKPLFIQSALDAMLSMGWKKREAEKICSKKLEEWSSKNEMRKSCIDDFVKYVIIG